MKYVPSIGVDRPIAYVHKFGHVVKRIPVYKRLIAPRALLRPRKYEGGLTTLLRPLLGPSFTINLINEASKDRINLLHYSSYYSLFFVPSFTAAWRFPMVAQYTGGSLPNGALSRPVWKVLLTPGLSASSAVLLGDYASEIRALTGYLGVDRKKMQVFDAPIFDEDVFRELDKAESQRKLGMDPSKKHILCVTFIPTRHSIGFAKDPFLLVDIFAEAVRQGLVECVLHIVGWGPGEQDLRDYVASQRLGDRVMIHGYVEHQKLPAYFSAADLAFVPYPLEKLNEGSVTIEAFACSRPVAAFKRADYDQTEQLGGFLVETEPSVGGKTLTRYAIDSGFLRKKGREGLEFSKTFNLEFAGRRLESIYAGVMKSKA